eukprot:scaffold23552_cov133-Isochrysis_galbana.AAC.2
MHKYKCAHARDVCEHSEHSIRSCSCHPLRSRRLRSSSLARTHGTTPQNTTYTRADCGRCMHLRVDKYATPAANMPMRCWPDVAHMPAAWRAACMIAVVARWPEKARRELGAHLWRRSTAGWGHLPTTR